MVGACVNELQFVNMYEQFDRFPVLDMSILVSLEQLINAPAASVHDAQEMPGKVSRFTQPENMEPMSVADPVYKLDDTVVSCVHPSKVFLNDVHPVVGAVKSTRTRLVQFRKVLANEVIGAIFTSLNLLQPLKKLLTVHGLISFEKSAYTRAVQS